MYAAPCDLLQYFHWWTSLPNFKVNRLDKMIIIIMIKNSKSNNNNNNDNKTKNKTFKQNY